MAHALAAHLKPQACMCEGTEHGSSTCDAPAEMVATYDGTPVPLCRPCLDATHMGEEDRPQDSAR